MPQPIASLRVNRDFGPGKDRRRKLDSADKALITRLHREGESIHSLAKQFGVSRRLVQFVLFPERQQECLRLRRERGGSKQYYDREKFRAVMRKHRAHKRRLAEEEGDPG